MIHIKIYKKYTNFKILVKNLLICGNCVRTDGGTEDGGTHEHRFLNPPLHKKPLRGNKQVLVDAAVASAAIRYEYY